jgi:UDP-2,3-diacylglucosamine pyrophosphatase LpxH
MTRRIYISDIHISLDAPYSWLSQAERRRLLSFLASDDLRQSDQLFLVGDVVDLWAYPINVRPPTFCDIMAEPHNKPIVDALNEFSRSGRALVYMNGNHDMQATRDEVRSVFPQIAVYPDRFRDRTLHIEHGHAKCLFNGTDPRANHLPFGYFITRLTTTGEDRGHGVNMNLWTILRNANHVFALVTDGRRLGEAVFDVCVQETCVGLDEDIVMPDGSTIKVGAVRDMYADCYDAWDNAPGRNDAYEAVLAEWDPFYALPYEQRIKMSIAGHSHDHIFSYRSSDHTLYMNTGSWCSSTSHYAKTWNEDGILWGALYEWDGSSSRRINRAGVPVQV